MKIYCNTQEDQDLEFFKSIAGTEYWVRVTNPECDYGSDWYINISAIKYIDGKFYMIYTCVLKDDVDNAYLHDGYTEREIYDVLDDCDCVDDIDWCQIVKPVDILTRSEIEAMLLEGTHK